MIVSVACVFILCFLLRWGGHSPSLIMPLFLYTIKWLIYRPMKWGTKKIYVRLITKLSTILHTYLFYYLQIGLEVCIFLHRKFHLKNDWVVVKKPFTIFLIKLSFILSTVGAEVKRQGPSRQEKKIFFDIFH